MQQTHRSLQRRRQLEPGIRGLPLLPVEPLRLRAVRYPCSDLARMFATRHGVAERAAKRAACRLVTGSPAVITFHQADRWCVALGLHPEMVWSLGEEAAG